MNVLPTTGELFATNQVSPETERGYKYQLRNFAQWMCDNCDVEDMEDVTTADLLAYRQSLQRLAGSTQKRYLAAIKSFFAWALEAGIVEKKTAASLKLPRALGNKVPVLMTLDETRLLLDTVKLPRDVALLWCLAYGLRIAELTALEICDISPPNGNGRGALMVRGKGNKARTLPICAEAHDAISAYVSGRTDGAVFHVLDGSRPMTRRAIQDRFMNLAARAGIPTGKAVSALYAARFRYPDAIRY